MKEAPMDNRFRPYWLVALLLPAAVYWSITLGYRSLSNLIAFVGFVVVAPTAVAAVFSGVRAALKRPAAFWAGAIGGTALLSCGVYLVELLVKAFPRLGYDAWGYLWSGLLASLVIAYEVFLPRLGFLFCRFWSWLFWRLPLRAVKRPDRLVATYVALFVLVAGSLTTAALLTHGFKPSFEDPGKRFTVSPLSPVNLSFGLCSSNNQGDRALLTSPDSRGRVISDSAGIYDEAILLEGSVEAVSGIAIDGSWFLVKLPDGTEGYLNSAYLEGPYADPGTVECGKLRSAEAIALDRPHFALVADACGISRSGRLVRTLAQGELVEVYATFASRSILADNSVIGNSDLIALVDPACGESSSPVLVVAGHGRAWADLSGDGKELTIAPGTKATLLGAAGSSMQIGGHRALTPAVLRLADGRIVLMDRLDPLFCATAWNGDVIGVRIETESAEDSPDPFTHLEAWKADGSAIVDQGKARNAFAEGLAICDFSSKRIGAIAGALLVERLARRWNGSRDEEGSGYAGEPRGRSLRGVFRYENATWLEAEADLAAQVALSRLRSLSIDIGPISPAASPEEARGTARGISISMRQWDFIDEKGEPNGRIRLDYESRLPGESDKLRDISLEYSERFWASMGAIDQQELQIERRSGTFPNFDDIDDFGEWLSGQFERYGEDELKRDVRIDAFMVK